MNIDDENENTSEIIEAFCEAAYEQRGLMLEPADTVLDKIGRCPADTLTNTNGAYRLYMDAHPGGWFKNHADGIEECTNWKYESGGGERLSQAEEEARRREQKAREEKMAAERAAAARKATEEARRIWEAAGAADGHPYLTKKKIAPHDLRMLDGVLIVPMCNISGELQFIQRIGTDGEKKFQDGSSVTGLSWRIGSEPQGAAAVVIAEGVATGASIHEITGQIVLVAFNCGNLKHVAEAARRKWPKASIIIAGDDDHITEQESGVNPGLKGAVAAAISAKGKIVVPKFGDDRKDGWTDFNDLATECGQEALRNSFIKPLKPAELITEIILTDQHVVHRKWLTQAYREMKVYAAEAHSRLRSELIKRKVRVSDLDGEPEAATTNNAADEDDKKEKSHVKILLGFAEKLELFHTKDGEAYADIVIDGRRETWPVHSRGFRRWIKRQFFNETRSSPSSEALQGAISTIEAMADADGPQRDVFVRVALFGGKVYLDLTDDKWRAVEIGADGWCVVDRPPVRFRRHSTARPLPEPLRGGSISELRPVLNIKPDQEGDKDFVLCVGFLLGSLYPHKGGHAILTLTGVPGAAKSTRTEFLRRAVDPAQPLLKRLPHSDRDAFIAANNTYMLAYENVSQIQQWLSDVLCAISTGAGLSTRKLHTDSDEQDFDVQRPMIINGIDFATEPDFADRVIGLVCHRPDDTERKTKEELVDQFENAHPRTLGALLDAAVNGIRNLGTVALNGEKPRLLDFTRWVVACENGSPFVDGVAFEEAYADNRAQSSLRVIEGSRIARELIKFMSAKTEWSGLVGELLEGLDAQLGEGKKPDKWPPGPSQLGGALRKIAPHLPTVGLWLTIHEHGKQGRPVTISTTKPGPRPDSEPPTGDGGDAIPGETEEGECPQNTLSLSPPCLENPRGTPSPASPNTDISTLSCTTPKRTARARRKPALKGRIAL
jgi:phage/plasmid primase-like uncharacterized protein